MPKDQPAGRMTDRRIFNLCRPGPRAAEKTLRFGRFVRPDNLQRGGYGDTTPA